MSKKKIYFDYAATTPVDKRVLMAMKPYFAKDFANTMSLHTLGREVAEVVEAVRLTIANYIDAKTEEIVFTSSATESNNWALKGVAWANKDKGKHIIISPIEHDCVLESAKWLQQQGFEVSMTKVDKDGLVDLEDLKKLIKPETILVSIIWGNNEIGTIQDIEKIGRLCREKGVIFHTDAAQSFGKEMIEVEKMQIDLLTASSHKIYGPKGAAILYIRDGTKMETLLHGGGHEDGRRSSTVNVPAIVGMGKAVEILKLEGDGENRRLEKLRDRIITEGLKIKGSRLNGHPVKRLPNNVNLSFEGVEGESLMLELDMRGIEVSTGSACSSKNLEPSHVLMAIGLKAEVAHGSLRISLGRETTEEEVDYLIKVLPEIVEKFRKISPYKL